MVFPLNLQLSNSSLYWRRKLKFRQKRLSHFIAMDAPDLMIEQEKKLVRQARVNWLAHVALSKAAWEIDIVTGNMKIDGIENGELSLLVAIFAEDDDSITA